MDDRELLELAAKAIGGEFSPGTTKHRIGETWEEWEWIGPQGITGPCFIGTAYPLTDGGDALRLAIEVDITIDAPKGGGFVYAGGQGSFSEPVGNDKMAAVRRAIVRAAAEIGRAAHQSKGEKT